MIDVKSWPRRHPWRTGFIVLLLILVAVRAYLPTYLKKTVNQSLANLEGPFCGKIGDLDLHIIRGAYSVQDVQIFSRAGKDKPCDQKIFRVDEIDLSLSWSQLFRGRARFDVEAYRPSLALDTLTRTLEASQKNAPETHAAKGAENVWAALVPWRLDSLTVSEGELYYPIIGKDQTKPILSNLEARVSGLEASKHGADPVPFTVRGNALETALVLATGELDLSKEKLRWDVDLSAERVDLSKANPVLLQRVPLSFTTGLLDTYGEMKGEGAELKGYVKLLFSNMDVVADREKWKGFKHGVIEILNSVVFTLLESPKVDTTGTILVFRKDKAGFQMETGDAAWRAIEHRLGDPVKKGIENRYSLDKG
jgi:hypothetical protein